MFHAFRGAHILSSNWKKHKQIFAPRLHYGSTISLGAYFYMPQNLSGQANGQAMDFEQANLVLDFKSSSPPIQYRRQVIVIVDFYKSFDKN